MARNNSRKTNRDGVIVVKHLRDNSNDPFPRMKTEKAKAFIEKHGLPEGFTNEKKKSKP